MLLANRRDFVVAFLDGAVFPFALSGHESLLELFAKLLVGL
jgi:hypothetical protein